MALILALPWLSAPPADPLLRIREAPLRMSQSCVPVLDAAWEERRACSLLTTAARDEARITQTATLLKIFFFFFFLEYVQDRPIQVFNLTGSFCLIISVLGPSWSCAEWIPPSLGGVSSLWVREEEGSLPSVCC